MEKNCISCNKKFVISVSKGELLCVDCRLKSSLGQVEPEPSKIGQYKIIKPEYEKWEFISLRADSSQLNDLGELGWEFCAVIPLTNPKILFKRKKL